MVFDVLEYLEDLLSNKVPAEWQIDYEERAAILEFDGGLQREDAEAQALEEVRARTLTYLTGEKS